VRFALIAGLVVVTPPYVFGEDNNTPEATIRLPKAESEVDDQINTEFKGRTKNIPDGSVPIGFVIEDKLYREGQRTGYPLMTALEANKRIDTRFRVKEMQPGKYWIVLWMVPEKVLAEILDWKTEREAYKEKFGSVDGHPYSFLESVKSQGTRLSEQAFVRILPD